jgi:hypothetical protein
MQDDSQNLPIADTVVVRPAPEYESSPNPRPASAVNVMRIAFVKISDEKHAVRVTRADGSSERVEVDTREYLLHDLAHYVIEFEFPIRKGFWGCVASGASLSGEGVAGSEARLAESLAGPIQTLIRIDAGADVYAKLLSEISPTSDSQDLAARVHERVRRIRGHWKATPYGGEMELDWPE